MTPFIEKVKDFLQGDSNRILSEILDMADNLTEAEILQLAIQIQIKDSIDYVADKISEASGCDHGGDPISTTLTEISDTLAKMEVNQ